MANFQQSDDNPTANINMDDTIDNPIPDFSSITYKKEEYRKYLEKSGVLEAFRKVLVGLYEEPDRQQMDAIEYVKQYLGAPASVDWEGLKQENATLQKKIEQLEQQLAQQTTPKE